MFNKELLMMNSGGSGSSEWYKGLPYTLCEGYPKMDQDLSAFSASEDTGAYVVSFDPTSEPSTVYLEIDVTSSHYDYINNNLPESHKLNPAITPEFFLLLFSLFPNYDIANAFIQEYGELPQYGKFLAGFALYVSSYNGDSLKDNIFGALFSGIDVGDIIKWILQSWALYGGEYLIEDEYVQIEVTPYDPFILIEKLMDV